MIWDIQRIGPEHRPADAHDAGRRRCRSRCLSHGDTQALVLLPALGRGVLRVRHAARSTWPSGSRRRCSCCRDLDLGMNNWMTDPFPYPEKPWDRGKVLERRASSSDSASSSATGTSTATAIPYRTLPGTPRSPGAYFTRGSGHDEEARYTESREAYAREHGPPGAQVRDRADAGAAAGRRSTDGAPRSASSRSARRHWAMVEARDQLRAEPASRPSTCCSRRCPFTRRGARFVARHERVYVVEQNRDAQMASLLRHRVPGAGRARSARPPLRRAADRRPAP